MPPPAAGYAGTVLVAPSLLLFGLAGCALPAFSTPSCDPRVLAAGEVRARPILCTEELVPDGDGHVGDWVIENSLARFVLRGTYSSLYTLDEQGGTLVDAVAVLDEDGTTSSDVLGELRVPGDRSSVEVVNPAAEGEGAALVLPGMTWSLAADEAVLRLTTPEGAVESVVQPLPGSERTGATWVAGEGFFGTDGAPAADDLLAATLSLSLVAPDEGAWATAVYGGSEAVEVEVDADRVRVEVDGALVARLAVDAGLATGAAPAGATLVGERDGCSYVGLEPEACGSMNLRVRDQAGADVAGTYTVNGVAWVVPPGGGEIPAGLSTGAGVYSAGPAFPPVDVDYAPDARPGAAVDVALRAEMDTDGAAWADLAREVAPDLDARLASPEATHAATGEGLEYVVVIADDEVPTAATDPRDALAGAAVLAVAGTRSTSSDGGTVISWPWTANSKRPAHGAPPRGLDALDLLSVARNNSADRRTIVDRAWVEAALAAAPAWSWPDAPLAVWLDSLDDVDVYLSLLDSYVPVAPVSARTWIELPTGDHNVPGIEAGIFAGATTAGSGPRIEVLGGLHVGVERAWEIVVHAPRWMGVEAVTVLTADGSQALDLVPFEPPYGGGSVRVRLPASEPWVVVTAEGAAGTWAVRGF